MFPHRFIKSADVPKLHTQWAKKGTITDIKYEFMKEQSNKMFRESLPSKQKYTIKTEDTSHNSQHSYDHKEGFYQSESCDDQD